MTCDETKGVLNANKEPGHVTRRVQNPSYPGSDPGSKFRYPPQSQRDNTRKSRFRENLVLDTQFETGSKLLILFTFLSRSLQSDFPVSFGADCSGIISFVLVSSMA